MKRILGVAGVAAVLATASPARADRAEELAAQTLYDKALELMKAGKPASACPLLSESQRLDPAAGTQYRLAECFEKTGRTEAAWRLYTEVAEASKKAGRKDREAQARDRAEALRKLLPRLTITVPPDVAKAEGLVVTRDEKAIPREEWNLEVPVELGEHTVEVRATGKKAWRRTVTSRAGATEEVARSVARYSSMASTDFSTCTAMRLPAGSLSETSKLASMAVARSMSRHE